MSGDVTTESAVTAAARKVAVKDPEIVAIQKVKALVDGLRPEEALRVLDYVRARVVGEAFDKVVVDDKVRVPGVSSLLSRAQSLTRPAAPVQTFE